jgi:glycosyltransferase involved in cell wall biosynthesis
LTAVTVLHLITKLDHGGAQETALALCEGLRSLGHAPLLAAGPPEPSDTDFRPAVEAAGVEYVELPSLGRPVRPLRDLLALVAIVRLLRRTRPSVLHTHSSKAGMLGRLAGRVAGVPVVVHTVHGWSFHDEMHQLTRAAYVAAERLAARLSDALVVVTELDRRKGLRHGIGGVGQYHVIRSGIDVEAFASATHPAGRSGDGLTVGSITRLSEQKDPETLVRAMSEVLLQRPEVRGVVVGDGPLRTTVERLVQDLGLVGRIELLGARNDIAELLVTFDVFVLSSRWEGLPRVVIEAMASGTPVVATAVDGVVEVLAHQKNGLLVPPGDPKALADAIVRLLDHPDERRRYAESARRKIVGFRSDAMVEETALLYERLRLTKGERRWSVRRR